MEFYLITIINYFKSDLSENVFDTHIFIFLQFEILDIIVTFVNLLAKRQVFNKRKLHRNISCYCIFHVVSTDTSCGNFS